MWNNKQRLRPATLDLDADDAAGHQYALGIRQLRARQHCIGIGLNLNIEEIGDSWIRIDGADLQFYVNRNMRVLVGRCSDPVLIVDNVGLAGLERDVNRILTDDGCQRTR